MKLLSNTIPATEFLPDTLAVFLASHPNADIELEERSSDDIIEAVSAGYADAGIIVDAGYHGDLHTLPFAEDRLVLIAQRGHPLAKKRRLAFRELAHCEFVELSTGRALAEFLSRQAARAGQPINVRVRMTSFDAICRMAEFGAGVAIVPERAARRHRKATLSIVSLSDDFPCATPMSPRLALHWSVVEPATLRSGPSPSVRGVQKAASSSGWQGCP